MRNIETIEKLGNLEVESEIKFNEFVSELTEKYSFDSENDLVIAIQNVKFGWKEMDAFSYLGNRMTWLAVLHLDFTEQKDLKDEEVTGQFSKALDDAVNAVKASEISPVTFSLPRSNK